MKREPFVRYKSVDPQTACCASVLDSVIFNLLPSYGETLENNDIKGIVCDVFHLGPHNTKTLEKQMIKRFKSYLKDDPFFAKDNKKELLSKVNKIDFRLEEVESEPNGLEKTFKLLCKDDVIDPDTVYAIEENASMIFGTDVWKVHKIIMSEKTKDFFMKIYGMYDFYEAVLLDYYDYFVLLCSGEVC